jgi:ELWxxDGT repeat protein
MASVRNFAVTVALLGLLATQAIPVAAHEVGIHLAQGPADDAGCHSLEVWNNHYLIETIPADDGWAENPGCAYNEKSALLPNGNFIFDWKISSATFWNTGVWGTDGTPANTQELTNFGTDFCDGSWQVIGGTAFVSGMCETHIVARWIEATRGTPASTFILPGDAPTGDPFYVVVGERIVYAAGHPRKGREIWVSNGTPEGSFLLKDIRRGRRSSNPSDFVSTGARVYFTANDGTGRADWVTNGKKRGTHRL